MGDDVFLAHHEIFDGTVVQKTVFMHGLDDALAASYRRVWAAWPARNQPIG